MVPPKGSKTAQNYELQMGTNVLGSFLLTKLLLPILEKTAASSPAGSVRATFAGSLAVDLGSPTGGVTWTDDEPTVHSSQQTNYGQSKAGNVLLASALRRRVAKLGIISKTSHGKLADMEILIIACVCRLDVSVKGFERFWPRQGGINLLHRVLLKSSELVLADEVCDSLFEALIEYD